MATRPTVKFTVEGLGEFELHTELTIAELERCEVKLEEFFGGKERYDQLVTQVEELETYRTEKNIASLSEDTYRKLQRELTELVRQKVPTEPDALLEYQKAVTEKTKQFFYDGKIGLLNQLRERLSRARELVEYEVLTKTKPDSVSEIATLAVDHYKRFREAAEDSLSIFRRASERPAPNDSSVTQSRQEGAAS